ncbi:hypothetical protein BASA50_002301 [Batrachochytrium salamandrivorans]|uniref:DUF4371 domain-containing protein n=1 Tax=Batrachochytrium salamandrivorans TaxID=1357716 RepID=A0ABQ8FLN9_9FUNG|nr:hypothetical protein BASA50_002301 [Batrachochytrium salamandrivorans]
MAPPAKRGKAAAPRDTLFNHQHTLTYGLKVVSKDAKTGKVDLVACRLCIAFGIEEKVGAKRQKTVCKKTFGPQFRPENYRSHLTTQHPKAWAAYQLKCNADKAVFFDVAVPFVNTIISHMDLERDHITYRLDKLIIEVIIEQMLWDPEDIDGLTFDNAMRIFTLDEPSGDYMVTIKTPMAYNLAVKHVGIGISMKQTALALQATKEEANVAKFGAMNQSKIATFVRVQCAANFQIIANVLCRVWVFALALDASTCQGTSYVDVRVRFVWQRQLYNLHVVSVPFFGSHTGEAQFEMIYKLFDVLSPNWKQQLIGASSDEAPNMTGAVSGVITRLEQAALGGFYRVWCLLHQLDLPLQAAYQNLDDGKWLATLVAMISHLRRQLTLVAEMGSVCPKTSTTRWHAMCSSTFWLTDHRHEVMDHYGAMPAGHPRRAIEPDNAAFWILCSVTSTITSTIHSAVMRMQTLRRISCRGRRPERLFVRDDFSVEYADIATFVEDLGHFEMTELAKLDAAARKRLLDNVAFLVTEIVLGFIQCCALRNSRNASSETPAPPTHPSDLVKLRGRDIAMLIDLHKDRLDASWTPSEIDKIGLQFRALCTSYHNDDAIKAAIDAHDQASAFDAAWAATALDGRFDYLARFIGGLTTPFPNTAPVESDFSILKFRKDAFKKSLTDFSLEAFLQCKQYDNLRRLKQ